MIYNGIGTKADIDKYNLACGDSAVPADSNPVNVGDIVPLNWQTYTYSVVELSPVETRPLGTVPPTLRGSIHVSELPVSKTT